MTPTAIVRQQAGDVFGRIPKEREQAKRELLEKLKRPSLEMVNAGYDVSDMAFVSGTNIRKIFVAMIEEFEKNG